jgi:transposase InsO family protein
MPWREVSVVEQRREFVRLASVEGTNRRELCRRFGVHPSTGYKWLGRGMSEEELADRSRRPLGSPERTDAAIEESILQVRDAHPAWGARKIVHYLKRQDLVMPAFSTTHEILRRHGRIVPPLGGARADQRFERALPNDLWQMDFKGWMTLANGSRCHPLTVVDDHSRYLVCVQACADEQRTTVQERLTLTFRRYGLPEELYVDNGSPWGDSGGQRWTALGVWLLKLGVKVIHSRPYHPQGRGKNERFHRTLNAEVFALERFRDLAAVQPALDRWRLVYNLERPHEALANDVPASRYRPSKRPMPDRLPEVDYGEGEIVRRVPTSNDYVAFKGRRWKVPQAFRGEPVAIRPLTVDGRYGVFFGAHKIAEIDLTRAKCVGHVPEQVSTMSPG